MHAKLRSNLAWLFKHKYVLLAHLRLPVDREFEAIGEERLDHQSKLVMLNGATSRSLQASRKWTLCGRECRRSDDLSIS